MFRRNKRTNKRKNSIQKLACEHEIQWSKSCCVCCLHMFNNFKFRNASNIRTINVHIGHWPLAIGHRCLCMQYNRLENYCLVTMVLWPIICSVVQKHSIQIGNMFHIHHVQMESAQCTMNWIKRTNTHQSTNQPNEQIWIHCKFEMVNVLAEDAPTNATRRIIMISPYEFEQQRREKKEKRKKNTFEFTASV